jgi:hypothetical protein
VAPAAIAAVYTNQMARRRHIISTRIPPELRDMLAAVASQETTGDISEVVRRLLIGWAIEYQPEGETRGSVQI